MSAISQGLRVLLVTARYFPYIGGVETHVHEVGRRLASNGVNITLLTTMPYSLSTPLPKEEVVEGMRIIRVRAWPRERDYYFAPEMYSIIKQGDWDLVHCQGFHTLVAPLTMLAAWRAKIPYVVTFHSGGDSSLLRKALRGVQRMALRPLLAKAERLIGPSKWEIEFFRERLHLPSSQFMVIPNGANHLPQLIPSEQGTKDGTLIVAVGRLEWYKGHQRVIAALPKVQEQVPDVRLRIVGVGPYESALQKMARELGVAERVEIGGVPPGDGGGMASVIAQADLVTLLSEHEAQGIAVLEALALRCPVLVAGTSALQEFAERGLARAVPLESTPEEVAAAVLHQLREPLIPSHVTLPTWDECANDLLALYRSLKEPATSPVTEATTRVSCTQGMDRRLFSKKPEASSSAVQTAAFVPARILEIELSRPLPHVSAVNEQTGQCYQRALCLVRLHTQPLGIVELKFATNELTPDEYVPKIWQALNEQVNEHLQQDGLPPVTELTANGLPSLNVPTCIEEHEQFLTNAPFVSVIVPTHDRPEQLASCLNSLMSLRYPQYEIIVVDNAPRTHATAELVQGLSRSVPYICYVREDRQGVSWARNRGMMVARSKILAFTDDDVIVDPYWLVGLVRGFELAENVACVTGLILPMELETQAQAWFEEFGGFSKGFTRRIFDRTASHTDIPLYPYAAGQFGTGAGMAFRADFLRDIGGFDPALGTGNTPIGGEDLATFLQVLLRGYKLVYEPASLLYHPDRRDYAGLRKQIYNYGMGPTAILTKTVLENPLLLFDLITKVPYGLFFILSSRSPKNRKKSKDYPEELDRIELIGLLCGPFAYTRSRWMLHRACKPSRPVETSIVVSTAKEV
jgi:glycosyltransferase involved in cell wall biosynthesis/GT2 family glycosyltransferase